MPQHSRRKTLVGIGAAVVAGLAGCNSVGGPNPDVVETEQEVTGDEPTDVTFRVLVENSGSTGRVQVTVTTLDGNGDKLEFFGRIVEIEGGEQQQVEFDVTLTTDAASIEAEAEPA
jgi:aconitase B